jgi:hypothetical protein
MLVPHAAIARCDGVYVRKGDIITLKFDDAISGHDVKQAGQTELSSRVAHVSSGGTSQAFPVGSEIPIAVSSMSPGLFGRGGKLQFSFPDSTIDVQCPDDRKTFHIPVEITQPSGGVVPGATRPFLLRILIFVRGQDAVLPKSGQLTIRVRETTSVQVHKND